MSFNYYTTSLTLILIQNKVFMINFSFFELIYLLIQFIFSQIFTDIHFITTVYFNISFSQSNVIQTSYLCCLYLSMNHWSNTYLNQVIFYVYQWFFNIYHSILFIFLNIFSSHVNIVFVYLTVLLPKIVEDKICCHH